MCKNLIDSAELRTFFVIFVQNEAVMMIGRIAEKEKLIKAYESEYSQFVTVCKAFHKYGFWGACHINNVEAREQFNILCLYIARIYNLKRDYSNVLFWANKLAYVPSMSIAEWTSLLNTQDYEELRNYFTNCDIDREAISEVLNDYLTRPCD